MKSYQHFATVLAGLLGTDTAVRLTANGYMPLSIEHIGQSAEGNRLIALCHYGEQNGDLMRDPEMVFEIYASPTLTTAEPLSFRNDYMGLMQEVYRYDIPSVIPPISPIQHMPIFPPEDIPPISPSSIIPMPLPAPDELPPGDMPPISPWSSIMPIPPPEPCDMPRF